MVLRNLVLSLVALVAAASCQILSGGDGFEFGAGGAGGAGAACSDDAQCPSQICHQRRCESGHCELLPVDAGSACEPGSELVCDEDQRCVGCLVEGDCDAPTPSCDGGVCVPETCTDGQHDPPETDTDCGGSACAPCNNGQACLEGSDCESGFCNDDSECAPCAETEHCSELADSYCELGTCVPQKERGATCNESPECLGPEPGTPGHCVDQVCCDRPCNGTCEACTNEKTGGASGNCLPIPDGKDPDEECADVPPLVRHCDGSGACVISGG